MSPAQNALSERPATEDDAEFLFRVYASTRAEEVAAFGWPAAQQEAFLRMQYNVRRQSYGAAYPTADRLILLAGGVPAGSAIVARAAGEIRLVDIAFLAEFRGRGLGTEWLSRLIAEAHAAPTPLRLSVMQGNPAARLYERLGFVPRSAGSMYIEMEHTYARSE